MSKFSGSVLQDLKFEVKFKSEITKWFQGLVQKQISSKVPEIKTVFQKVSVLPKPEGCSWNKMLQISQEDLNLGSNVEESPGLHDDASLAHKMFTKL